MLKDKDDILPFLILSAHAEKIVIIVMSNQRSINQIFVTCWDTLRSISFWRNIELTIKKSKYLYYNILSYKFIGYEAVWNIIKMKCTGKCEIGYLIFLISLLIFRILHIGSKLFHFWEVLLRNLAKIDTFYIIGSDI